MRKLDHRKLYRLPWSVTDNVISWLEPTKECNIYCDGCYSANAKGSHKSLAQVRSDLDVFEKFRQTDAVSVAGGDPLVHPEIVEVVRMIASRGLKPVVNTNGHGLTPSLLRDMKSAGLAGFTFHVDSLQTRPGWKGATELELNELRQEYADRVAEVGGISCAFNSTVYEKTLPFAPDILEWARRNADKVHVVVFIAFRAAIQEQFRYFAGEEQVEVKGLTYTRAAPQRTDIDAQEIVEHPAPPLPRIRAGRLPERHRGPRLLQVAHDPARGGQGALLRQRRAQVRRALPGLEPPPEGSVPGLRAPLDPRQRPELARAVGPRPHAGAVLGIQVDGKSQIQVLYLFARPQARFQSTSPVYASSPSFGVTTQYLQVGGLTTFDQGPLEPFLSGGLGLAWYHPSDVPVGDMVTLQPEDTFVFAFHLGGGVKWWLSEAIGLRLEARFLMPVFFNSGAFLSGPNGAMLRVSGGIPIVQGDVSLGLAIAP